MATIDPTATAEGRPYLDLSEAIERCLGDVRGAAAADIGCGSGAATRVLAALGAETVGVEPNAEALAAAREAGGGPRYVDGAAAATGLDSQSVDLVLFSDSLHHAPDPAAGLVEAIRILKPSGQLAVLEPEAEDPLYAAARFVDDEAAAYAEVRAALDAAVAERRLRRTASLFFAARYRADDPETLLSDMLSVDPTRRLADADRPAFEAAFAAALETDADGRYLPYWRRLDAFRIGAS